MTKSEPLVFLVGAGPGHPDLLTVRACQCLERADVVIYDQLVPERVLDLAPARAQRIRVDELAGRHAERIPAIHETMLAAARQGRRVVRLKGGDPFVFGRGAEEAQVLRRAGIPYEIIPGITAGIGAGAYTGIPLTHRAYASAVTLVAGHEDREKEESAVDWKLLAQLPGTLIIYMGMQRLPQIVAALIKHGKPSATPAAVIEQATTGQQRIVESSLVELPERASAEGMNSPAVVFVGQVVALRQELSWFERRPLFGKRILVTRPRQQAAELVSRLEELGAVTLTLPMVEIRDPADWTPVDHALWRLDQYQWLVFTSANGVHALIRRLRHIGRDLRAVGSVHLAAIGPGTAEALRGYHLEPDLVPSEFRSEALAAELRSRGAGQRILLARADRGREVLRDELAAVAQVEQVAVYAQVDADVRGSPVWGKLDQGEIDYVTLTSSSIARAFGAALDAASRRQIDEGRVRLVSISPVTSSAIREMGLPVAAEAEVYTMEGVVRAVLKLAQVAQGVPAQIAKQGGSDQDGDIHGRANALAEREVQGKIRQE